MGNARMIVDEKKLRYGIEMMRAVLGSARGLSIRYADSANNDSWREIDEKLMDVLEIMDKHEWSVKKLFETAVDPNKDFDGDSLMPHPTMTKPDNWEDIINPICSSIRPRNNFLKILSEEDIIL